MKKKKAKKNQAIPAAKGFQLFATITNFKLDPGMLYQVCIAHEIFSSVGFEIYNLTICFKIYKAQIYSKILDLIPSCQLKLCLDFWIYHKCFNKLFASYPRIVFWLFVIIVII